MFAGLGRRTSAVHRKRGEAAAPSDNDVDGQLWTIAASDVGAQSILIASINMDEVVDALLRRAGTAASQIGGVEMTHPVVGKQREAKIRRIQSRATLKSLRCHQRHQRKAPSDLRTGPVSTTA